MIRRLLPVLIVPALFACEPSREQYRDDLANTLCERAEKCNNLNDYGGTFDECLVEERANVNNYLTAEKCSDGQINEDRFQACSDRVRTWSCSGLGSIGDAIDVANACKASTVCIDPAN